MTIGVAIFATVFAAIFATIRTPIFAPVRTPIFATVGTPILATIRAAIIVVARALSGDELAEGNNYQAGKHVGKNFPHEISSQVISRQAGTGGA